MEPRQFLERLRDKKERDKKEKTTESSLLENPQPLPETRRGFFAILTLSELSYLPRTSYMTRATFHDCRLGEGPLPALTEERHSALNDKKFPKLSFSKTRLKSVSLYQILLSLTRRHRTVIPYT